MMTTMKNYLVDVTTLAGSAKVTDIIQGPEKPIVRLESTWFHPQGGGQKADRGKIGGSNVLHVTHSNGDVDHYVDAVADLEVGKEYPFAVDTGWRRLNAAFHTAGHLIASVVEAERLGVRAVSGHQWPGEARVEFEGELSALDRIDEILQERIVAALAANLPVAVIGDPFTSRAIKIGDYAPIPCGGTHVQALGEIARINIASIKKKGQRIRVSYEASPVV